MKTLFKSILYLSLSLTYINISAQCSFTTNIAVSGSTVGCGSATLTAGNAGNTWTQKANFGGMARNGAVAFSIGGKGYFGNGTTANNVYSVDFWEFDPTSNAWTQRANFGGVGREGGVGFSVGSKGYVGTGYNLVNGFLNDFWEFDPTTNFWTQKANFSGTPRYWATGFSIGALGYLGTGYSSSLGNLSDFWEYNPSTNFWTQRASFAGQARYYATGMSIGSNGYIGGGWNNIIGYNDFWEYIPSTNTWSQKPNIGTVLFREASAFSIGNKGYIVAGYNTSLGASLDVLWEYDPLISSWQQRQSMGSANSRFGAAAFAIGTKGYIGTGYAFSSRINTFWEYESPGTYTWSNGANTQSVAVNLAGNYSVLMTNGGGCTATASQSISLSPNPTIIVTGAGTSCAGISNTLVASGAGSYTWSANAGGGNSNSVVVTPTILTTYTLSGTTGSCTVNYPIILTVNPSPSATLTVSGSTLGCGDRTLSVSGGTNVWTQKLSLNTARHYAVSFNIGSKGYLGTGYHNTLGYRDDFWEYDPLTNSWTQKASFGGGPRRYAAGFAIGNKGYIGTGESTGSVRQNDFWEYDPTTNTWTQKAAVGGGVRKWAVGFSIGSKGYMGTGESNISPFARNDFWEYDPLTNIWTQKANFGGSGRYSAVGFSIGSLGYIGTGYDGSSKNDFWEYNPSNNIWTQKSSIGTSGRYNSTGFGLGNKGYIGTGYNSGYLSDFWEFDQQNNSWIQKSNFPGGSRYAPTSFATGIAGYISTGYSSGGAYLSDLWQYNSANTFSWSNGSTLQSITASASGNYSVFVTSTNGCYTILNQSLSLTPNPTISVSGASLSCAGVSSTLIASGANSYTWSNNAGASNSNSVVVSPTILTTYTVSGTIGSCTSSFPVSLNVNQAPVATIAVNGSTLGCGQRTLSVVAGGNVWTQKAGLNIGRQYAVAFSIGNKGYVGTGLSSGSVHDDFWEYDPISNSWTQKANLTGMARYGAVGFAIGTKGYLGTGYGNSSPFYLNDFWEYDPSTNLWVQKANFSGTIRRNAIGFSLNNKGYLGMGNSVNWPYNMNDFWEYDPIINTWTQKANFASTARSYPIGFAINNLGYVGLGSGYSDFWEYNPTLNSWTQKANFAGGLRESAAAFAIGNKGFVGTGTDGTHKNDFWEYNPTTNLWTQLTNFGGVARYSGTGFSIGSKGYIGLGYSNSSPNLMNDIWEYEQSQSITWSTGSTLQAITVPVSGNYSVSITNGAGCVATSNQSLTLSPNPTITVNGASLACAGISNTLTANGAGTFTWSANAGGGNSNSVIVTPTSPTTYTVSGSTGSCSVSYPIILNVNPVPSATISVSGSTLGCGNRTLSVNAGGDTWTQKAGLNVGRSLPVSFSIGNKAYVGTGYNPGFSGYYNDFWEYDPATNAWTQKAQFGGAARYGAVGFAINGKGYIGSGYSFSYLSDFWEYDPLTNIWIQKANVGGLGRYAGVGFAIGTKGYIGLGYNGNYFNDFWEYDPTTNNWTQKANFSGSSRYLAVGFSIGGLGYVGTGRSPSYQNDFWEYNPSANSWVQKANFGGGFRSEASGFSIGSKGYVGLGTDGTNKNDFWEYDPTTNTWIQRANFGGQIRGTSTGFSIGQRGYLGLGLNSSTYLNDIWEYEQVQSIAWSTGSNSSSITTSTSGSYSVLVTNAFGCSASSSQSIALSPNPTISVTGNNSVTCPNTAFTLSASGAGSYTWSPNAGASNSNSVVVTPSITSTYTVSGSTGSCSSTSLVDVTMFPSADGSIIPIGSPTVCGSSITLSASVPQGNNWTQKMGLNTGRRYPVSFSVDNKGYIGTGFNGSYLNDFWEYNPLTNTWTQKANFAGVPRYGAVGFSIGSKGYLGTGNNGTNLSDFWEYNPSTNTWSQLANFSGVARHGAVGMTINNKGYLGTGYSNTYLNDFWEYDPNSNSWTQKANFSGLARMFAVGVAVSNLGYITTGTNGTNRFDLWEYNPTSNFWVQKTNFPGTARSGAAGFSLSNKFYITGGSSATDFWEYNTTLDIWTSKANFGGVNRINGTAFSISGKGYVSCGFSSSYFNDLWEYSPSISFLWSTGSTQQTISATASGVYSLTITNDFGCVKAVTQSVSISPSPTIIISGPTSICSGGSVNLTASGATNYTWSSNAGGLNTSSVNVSPSFATTYSLIGASNGCTTSASKPILVNALPTVTATTSSSAACMGNTFVLTGQGAATYTWSGGVANAISFTPTSTSTYTVFGTDFNNCTNAATISVVVNPLPTVSVNSGTMCYGQSFTLVPTGATSYTYSSGSSVVSPTTNTTYSITGSSLGCASAAPAIANITVLTSPTVSVNGGSICAGQLFTLNPIGAVSYSYTGGSQVVSPTITSNYTVTGYGSNGCSNINSAIASVTVFSRPVITAVNGTICNGNSYTIVPTGAVSYTFSSGSAVVNPSSNTVYSVSGTNSVGCESTNAATISVVVNPLPTVSVNSGTMCYGQSFTLVPTGATSYTYSSGSSVVSPTTNTTYSITGSSLGCASSALAIASITVVSLPLVSISGGTICQGGTFVLNPSGAINYSYSSGSQTVSPNTTTSYTITGTDLAGCESLPSIAHVTVSNAPIITVNSGSLCSGTIFTIVPQGASTYTFSGGSNTVQPTVSTSYSISGTSTNGCVSLVSAVSHVTVVALPSIIIPTVAFICTGSTYTIIPSGALTYTYSSGSNIVSPSTTTSYSVTGTSSLGCVGAPVVITVSVQPSLSVTIVGPSVSCVGQTIALSGVGANTFTWSTGANTQGIIVSPTVTTGYTVNAGSGNCTGVAFNTVIVNPNPLVSVSTSNSLVCEGEPANLSALGANTYTWNDGSSGQSIIVSPIITTTYVVTGYDGNGCEGSASLVQLVEACVGLSYSNSQTSLVSVYPNPNNGGFLIEIGSIKNDQVIELYNYLGQLIISKSITENKTRVDYNNFANGMYTLKIKTNGNTTYTTKLIKQ